MRRIACCALAWMIGVGPALWAESGNLLEYLPAVEVGGKDRFLFLRSSDPAADTDELRHRLLNEITLRAERGDWSAQIGATNRLDFENSEQPKALQLEKKLLAWESHDWTVRLGDSYHELGRGIALALYRDEVFGLDTTLEGASVRFRNDTFNVSTFAGRVNTWRSPVAVNPVALRLDDRTVALGGALVGVETEVGTFSMHGTGTFNRDDVRRLFDRHWVSVGAVATVPGLIPGVDAYVESNLLLPRVAEGTAPANGIGTYAALSYATPGWRGQVEAKDYRQYYYEFSRPPTLEEDVVETLNTQDVTAGRFSLSRSFDSNNTATATVLYGNDRMVHADLVHATMGGKVRVAPRVDVEAKAGYRTLPGQARLMHSSLKGQWKTFPGQSFELGYRKQRSETNLAFLPTLDDRNYFDATYVFSASWSLTLGYEWVPTNEDDVGQNFVNLGLRAKADSLQGRAFVGQTSGGTICSGGICRQVPPYAGAYVDATYSF